MYPNDSYPNDMFSPRHRERGNQLQTRAQKARGSVEANRGSPTNRGSPGSPNNRGGGGATSVPVPSGMTFNVCGLCGSCDCVVAFILCAFYMNMRRAC